MLVKEDKGVSVKNISVKLKYGYDKYIMKFLDIVFCVYMLMLGVKIKYYI